MSVERCPHCGGLIDPTSDPDTSFRQALVDIFGFRQSFASSQVRVAADAQPEDGPLRSIVKAKSAKGIGCMLRDTDGIEQIAKDKHGAIWWVERI